MGKRSKTRARRDRIGRNDPCVCGSGKKYKKCCLEKKVNGIPAELSAQLKLLEQRKAALRSKGIFIDLPNTTVFKGNTVLAVGNKIMLDPNPHATFHQLLLRNLQQTLGEEWWHSEAKKKDQEKHFIKSCYEELSSSASRDDLDIKEVDENTRTMLTTGNTQALMSLAFDVWLLTHSGFMPDEWLERLRDMHEYQGVRYEIGVASLFVRVGCKLDFYDKNERDENGKQIKRAEFIAIDKATENKVAVEAKSRRRDGVLHEPGSLKESKATKGDVTNLFRQALLKETDGLPLFVFIDVNAPTEAGQTAQSTRWFRDVNRSFDSRPAASPEDPDEYTGLFITNFSPHYQGDSISRGGQYMFVGSEHPKNPVNGGYKGDLIQRLVVATGNYGYVPPSMDNEKIEIYKPIEITSQDDFVEKIRELTVPSEDDPNYKQRLLETENLVEMLVWDATQKAGGTWNNEVATECFRQFKWLYEH